MNSFDIKHIADKLPIGNIDLFITFSSFEERCVNVAKSLPLEKIQNVFICHFKDGQKKSSENTKKLENIFLNKYSKIEYSRSDPFLGVDNTAQALNKIALTNAGFVLIDITTFSREALLTIIKLLHTRPDISSKVYFIYNRATDYDPGISKEEKRLSYGVKSIRSVLGYPGNIDFDQKHHLVVMVGYEIERVKLVIEQYEPNLISLGFGSLKSSNSEDIYKQNVHALGKLKEQLLPYGSKVNEFEFCPYSPIDAAHQISIYLEQFKNYNTVLFPMNTKLSSIGAAIYAIKNEKTQLAYAEPIDYNYSNYSIPSTECVLLKFSDFF